MFALGVVFKRDIRFTPESEHSLKIILNVVLDAPTPRNSAKHQSPLEAVRLLLDRGADPNAYKKKDRFVRDGKTPLQSAERPLVLGHSWGTLVALAMAARNSEPVKGLVLVSGYYFPTWRFDVWFASIAAIPLIGDVLRYTISPISSWLALPLFAKKSPCRSLPMK